MPLTAKDLEKVQEQFSDYRMELVDEVSAEIVRQLANWVRPRQLGRVTASSAGFRLPNDAGDVRAPDASFVRAERLKRTTDDYAKLVPDLIFEVKSKSDSLGKLREKISIEQYPGSAIGRPLAPPPKSGSQSRRSQQC